LAVLAATGGVAATALATSTTFVCWWVLAPGVTGAPLIYAGRYIWFSPAIVWTGAAAMIEASLANFLFKRACCPCAGNQAHAQAGTNQSK